MDKTPKLYSDLTVYSFGSVIVFDQVRTKLFFNFSKNKYFSFQNYTSAIKNNFLKKANEGIG